MDQDILIDMEACRFCFKTSRNMVAITKVVKRNFQELMNEEVNLTNSDCSSIDS